MSEWIAKITESAMLGLCKALATPGVLLGLVRAWRQANEPEQVIASKPTKDDDNFLRSAQKDGWVNIPVVDKRVQQLK